jgi:hypothetical protein
MKYKPNFNDPRVAKKVNTALKFVLRYLNHKRPSGCSQSQLNKYMGRSNDNLGNYLREKLLITTNDWYHKDRGITKQYIRNREGTEELITIITGISTRYTVLSANALNGSNHKSQTNNTHNTHIYHYSIQQVEDKFVYDGAKEDFEEQLTTGKFEYSEKPTFPRLMHPIQNMRTEYRNQLLEEYDFNYEYDIVCCAPSLILHHSYQLGTGEYMPTITDYITNRKEIRQTLANELEINPNTIKKIINAMFCGAYISNNAKYSSVYKLLKQDNAKIVYMKENPWIQSLKQEIKHTWQQIKPYYPQFIREVKGNKTRHQLYAKDKWYIYFRLERQMIDHVKTYLDMNNVKSFLIHDGWRTNQPLNLEDLQQYLYDKTGNLITIEEHNK